MKKLRIPVYLQIFTGMSLGILAGIVALHAGGESLVSHWIKPWGKVFIRLLQLVAVPLVFISLVKGVAGLSDISRFSRIGLKTVVLYLSTTLFAILLGLTLVSTVKPGRFVDAAKTAALEENYRRKVGEMVQLQQEKEGPLQFLDDIVPDNIFGALSDNRRMLQIIFFALLLGVATLGVGREKAEPVMKLLHSLDEIVLKMIGYIIRLAPYGVMALMAGLVVDFSGDIGIFTALAAYAATVVAGLLLLLLGFYPLLVRLFIRLPVKKFLKEMYPVQLLAFTTSSSAATLPVTMDIAQNKLGVSEEVTSFVMPLGATINMDGTSCFQAISVVFIAQALGLNLGIEQLSVIVLMTAISSIGTPSIPSGSYVVMTMVLTAVGIPAEGMALILGVDRPLDMLRTSVNVTGDVTVASIVDKKSRLPYRKRKVRH
ncbi:MAG: dicarboxylate/amino acid:cation symporter [Tannerella sp.]|jgi:Na+/H+-dicarboxylate symporter|nr:dicarboxylate/amino acid:cation symporter [Tannerella sp.]